MALIDCSKNKKKIKKRIKEIRADDKLSSFGFGGNLTQLA